MSRGGPAWWVGFVALGVVVLALEWLWQGKTYWLYSEGVYLATARAVADGATLYRDVAAAQPPPLFYLGAALVEFSDSVLWVRGALACVSLATAALVAVAVLRLTGHRVAAGAAGITSLVLPWTLREHATLTPEPLAAPLLLGAALLAARTRLAPVAAALGLAAASLKLAFLLPVAAIGAVAAARVRYFATAVVLGVAAAGASLAVWGQPIVDNLIVAQRETGFQIGILPGHVAQSAWNLAPLVLLAALAVLARDRARDPALLRTLAALAGGSLVLVVTFVKKGTYINLIALIEPVLVPLAAAGLVWLLAGEVRPRRWRRLVPVAAWASVALVALQSLGVLIAPGNPLVFGNPFLDAPGRVLSSDGVDLAIARARACPPGVPHSGEPFFAFVADRPLPAGQPDLFIVREAPVHAGLREEVSRARPRCPAAPKGG